MPDSLIPDKTLDNHDLFEKRYWQYHDELRGYIARLLRCPEDADEVLQEVFVRVTRQPIDAAKPDKERAYLFVIAANLVKDRLRRMVSHRERDHVCSDQVELHSDAASPEDIAISEQLKHDLLAGLENLNERHREVFVMHRFKHMTHEQIADRLGVSVRTVERRMSSAIDHFRTTLRGYL